MILLDTHVLLWALEGSPKVGRRTREKISSASTRYVSAITHVELTIKSMKGKVRTRPDFAERVHSLGFEPLPLEHRHVVGLRAFQALTGHDPFDRLLLAQAYIEGLTFLTADSRLLALDEPWILDATS